MYLRVLGLVLSLLLLLALGVPATWWWLLAVPHLLAGVVLLIDGWVDAYLARLVEQEITGPHP